MFRKINLYDILLFVLLVLMAAGGLGGPLQPSRVVGLLAAPLVIYQAIIHRKELSTYRYEGILCCAWIIVAGLSLYKARNLTESIKQWIYLIVHIFIFFEVLVLSFKAKQPVNSILAGWIAMIAITFPVAIFEFATDIHLPLSVQETGSTMNFGYTIMERKFASVTYGNLNAYNQVICFTLPFILYAILQSQNKWLSIVLYGVWAMTAYIVVRNSSRGALLCLGASAIVFSFYYLRSGKSKIVFGFLLAAAGIVAGTFLLSSFDFILERITSQGTSDPGRVENIVVGMQALADSFFWGIGVGNYAIVLGQEYGVAITAPHNLLLEVIVLYGIVIFIGFCLMFVHIFYIARHGNKQTMLFFILCMVCLGTSFFIDSGHLAKVPTWVFFASILVGSNSRYNSSVQTKKTT